MNRVDDRRLSRPARVGIRMVGGGEPLEIVCNQVRHDGLRAPGEFVRELPLETRADELDGGGNGRRTGVRLRKACVKQGVFRQRVAAVPAVD